jgi:AcrR family transcriptional regulator
VTADYPTPEAAAEVELLPLAATVVGTRRKLLETALLLFAERGFHGVSVRDITAAVGVKASALYAHWSSKDQLLTELVRLGHQLHHDALRDAIDVAAPSPADQLQALVEAHVRNHATYPMLARVCANDVHILSPDSLSEILAMRLEVISLFINTIEAGMLSGDFDNGDPFLLTAAITAMGMRVAYWYGGNIAGLEFSAVLGSDMSPGRLYTADQIATTYADLALHMVRKLP